MTCQTIAKVLKRSVGHPDAPPVTSFQLRYPLQIHAELMTHRVFSRNARSSRAVPTARMLEEVRRAPFIPRYWGKNEKGMQASAECDEPVYLLREFINDDENLDYEPVAFDREAAWLQGRDAAADVAEAYAKAGYHKQLANRLLAPFLHIDVVLTTTNLSNWNALRDDPAAEPHIRDLAVAMKEAVAAYGDPDQLYEGQWHTPYVGEEDEAAVIDYLADLGMPNRGKEIVGVRREISVTRCAQVSYVPFLEAKLSIAEEIARHDKLVNARPMHASPAEHQATPDTRLPDGRWANPHLAGNLGPGWIQYRKTLAGECA